MRSGGPLPASAADQMEPGHTLFSDVPELSVKAVSRAPACKYARCPGTCCSLNINWLFQPLGTARFIHTNSNCS